MVINYNQTQICIHILKYKFHTFDVLPVLFQVCLRYYEHEFVELACQCPAVVCCRCSPTQKAQIVTLLQQHTDNRTCAIGQWSPLTLCGHPLGGTKAQSNELLFT